ncbi:DUF6189 family protein [Streptomyces boninensis]|uniref:DUF6189 family protein n=1 Tax=Streptomyces boninensis TaxID=2039455 RepID=UPI003B216DD3
MENRELAERTEQIIERILPRFEAHPTAVPYIRSVRGANSAGEWHYALETLVAVLAYDAIPVTADEHRDLKYLFDYFAQSRSADVRSQADVMLSDLAKVIVA